MAEQFLLPRWIKRDGPNGALLEAMWEALKGTDPELAAKMLALAEAAGPWLDRHGALYGIPRLKGEPDEAYRLRIIAELRTPRSTERAIETAIETAQPGVNARVYTLVGSPESPVKLLDGTWDLDGTYTLGSEWDYPDPWGRFVVDMEGEDVDLVSARETVERMRAAGMIPTVRFTFAFRLPHGAAAGYVTPRQAVLLDGSRPLDGSWTLDYHAQGPEEPL